MQRVTHARTHARKRTKTHENAELVEAVIPSSGEHFPFGMLAESSFALSFLGSNSSVSFCIYDVASSTKRLVEDIPDYLFNTSIFSARLFMIIPPFFRSLVICFSALLVSSLFYARFGSLWTHQYLVPLVQTTDSHAAVTLL